MVNRLAFSPALMLGCLFIGLADYALAQAAYPSKPVRLVVGFAPGGATDIVARIVAPKMGEMLKEPRIIVDNRAGAGQVIASEIVSRAEPDGYTLFMASAAFAINAATRKGLPFDSIRDFTPIVLAASAPNVLVVHPSTPARSVKELITLAREKPKAVVYGSAGVGAPSHLSGVLFELLARIELTHVPYKGSGQVMADLLGGRVQLSFPALSGALAHIESGKLIAIGVTTRKRSSFLPSVPSLEESGLTGYEASSWFGLMGPGNLRRPLVNRLNGVINQVLTDPTVQKQLARYGTEPVGGTSGEFSKIISGDIARWKRVITEGGITLN